ncbi:uncharacterized protein LOC123524453 [Mercenaria mercenaria]|uniref:uncharacterized protein LOC123524453 n=2 Tax=Mercenaria mercenaria TaxID=6596 RepID=UPI00234E88F1|nr:uncharacterized protein LOC123524453 [Mercenaria mercenaria]
MDDFIKTYFASGMKYREILLCLEKINGFKVSLRSLKRILSRMKLFRRINKSDQLSVGLYVMENVMTSSKQLGYKMMHQKLLQEGYVVTQETVRLMMHICDKEGIEQRRRTGLQRRMYLNLGPNYLWHIDGYDKLKPYGLCINGAIDGFSRFIIWLEVHKTNSDPKIIAGYFMNAVKHLQGCPTRARSDYGTENVYIRQMVIFLRGQRDEQLTKSCFLRGSSNHNQRIERWWGILRNENVQYWIDFFTMLKSTGDFNGSFLDKAVLQFCFMDLIQEELNSIVKLWNNHRIRPSSNPNQPYGRPFLMYHCPGMFGCQDYLCRTSEAQVNLCLEESIQKGNVTCDETVFELCTIIMSDHNMMPAKTADDAALLYQFLRREILNELHQD